MRQRAHVLRIGQRMALGCAARSYPAVLHPAATRCLALLQTHARVPTCPHYPAGPIAEEDRGKKTLVLDLDETLVHSSFKPIPQPDYVIPVGEGLGAAGAGSVGCVYVWGGGGWWLWRRALPCGRLCGVHAGFAARRPEGGCALTGRAIGRHLQLELLDLHTAV